MHKLLSARKLATQLNPVNRNITHSCCNIIVKLNAASHVRCRPAHPARRREWSCLCHRRLQGSKGDASLASGCHHCRVKLNTGGDRWRDGRADDCLVYSPYYHRTTDSRHGSKNIVLIMQSGWIASCGVCGSQRYKAKWMYWAHRQRRRQRPLCTAGGTSVKSRETDRENGHENQSPVFSHKRWPSQ